MVDSHAHLELEPLCDNPGSVVARAAAVGVVAVVTVGIDLEDAQRALGIADRFESVFACVGFHPHNAKDCDSGTLEAMQRLAGHPKVKGYGEIGLDFFRNRSPRDRQLAAFVDQLSLAQALGKPVVIHLRDAYDEGLRMLERAAPFPAGGVIHCFSGDRDDAQRALDLGFHISIPGTVTYKKNDLLRGIVRTLPDDRILLETDAPFLPPEPFRGKDNEPAYIVHTARKVAEVRQVSLERIAQITTTNAKKLFGLPI
ncbi:MAG: TatD family hydrolase [Desulfomonile tiedjei]|nr:TatD family hydrolase [Desulfomonile tiedjei]